MPVALIIAFAVSIGIHLVVLFGPAIELPTEPKVQPIMAELRPQPKPPPLLTPVTKPKPAPEKKVKKPRRKRDTPAVATPVLSVPESAPVLTAPPLDTPPSMSSSEATTEPVVEPVPDTPADTVPASVESRLPPRGIIRYRLDRGDRNFEIGIASQEWDIADGRYRLNWTLETTGLAWLIKSYHVDMESRGLVTSDGLRPESFSIRRNGKDAREKAVFDWEKMTVQVGKRPEQALASGAQDLLSFNYQLGFMSHSEAGSLLPLATGKKYTIYRLESLGDEEIDVPAGKMRTLHLRVPGDNHIDLWLAYDYLLLPVKIRFVESDGDVYVQVATQIQTSPP